VNPGLEVVKIGKTTVLNSVHTNYSFGGLHRVFQKAFARVNLKERSVKSVLILGFGAGSVASIIREELSIDCSITGIENDPAVLQLGRKYFNIDRFSRLDILEMDALSFLMKNDYEYDLIIVDVYVDFKVPDSCQTMEFINHLDDHLNPGGMVLFNKLIYNHQAAKEAEELENKFGTLSGETKIIKIREGMVNRMIVYKANNR